MSQADRPGKQSRLGSRRQLSRHGHANALARVTGGCDHEPPRPGAAVDLSNASFIREPVAMYANERAAKRRLDFNERKVDCEDAPRGVDEAMTPLRFEGQGLRQVKDENPLLLSRRDAHHSAATSGVARGRVPATPLWTRVTHGIGGLGAGKYRDAVAVPLALVSEIVRARGCYNQRARSVESRESGAIHA
jgi:hypothetical protein